MQEDSADIILSDPRFKGKPLTWELDTAEYDQIRHAWLTHVAAEEQLFQPYTEEEWKAQMSTMLSVFSDDCVMELPALGQRWFGRDGAERFYREFIPSFEKMEWIPQALVIGAQGVLDVVNMSGRLLRPFAGLTPAAERLRPQWVIFFPWLPEQRKFRGETVFSIRFLTEIERAK